ncbi:hypothetical protein [Sulfuriferula plumbiphila]|nr:hypothetical protein [Sulfuriferula plumbiphila]
MFNILSMLRKDSAEPDPLGSLKTIARWINDLPAGNVFKAHEQVLHKLGEFNAQNAQYSKERLDVLLLVDEHARPLQASLSQQYLRNPRMSRVMESRLWHAVYKFYREVAHAYHGFIMSYVANPADNPLRASMPQITLRTVHNFGNAFKWHYFRYEKPEHKLWLRLHNLYRVAEFEGFSKTELTLYPQNGRTTRCMDQYNRALLLGQLDASTLHPKQIEMADRWLCEWSHLIGHASQFNPDSHTLYVALSEGVGARRIRNTEFSASCRFLTTARLHEKIQLTRSALQNGESPALLGLGEDCRLPDCLEILDYAERQWGPLDKREQRKSPRTPAKEIIDVVHGFNEICALVKQGGNGADILHEMDAELKYDEMIDLKLYGFVTESTRARMRSRHATPVPGEKIPPHERWVMEDISEHGLGACVPADSNDWVRLGSMAATFGKYPVWSCCDSNDWVRLGNMVALKVERDASWKIGVMRRLLHGGDGLLQVGIEVLSHKPQMLLLRPQSVNALQGYAVGGVETTDATPPVPVIFTTLPASGPGELLLEAAQYASGRSFQASFGAQKGTIRLRDVIEKGDGWMRVAADVAVAEPGA